MKIGILTQPLHDNYGGLLQNYALQQVLIRMGHDPVTLDWDRISPSQKTKFYYVKRILGPLYRKMLNAKSCLQGKKVYYQPTEKEKEIISRNNRKFVRDYIRTTKKNSSEKDLLKNVEQENIEALVVGSDQVWRPRYNGFAINQMYLDFAKDLDLKRIAYAASFGTEEWEYTTTQTKQFSELIKKFDLVTVREDSGVRLCKEYLGVQATHVLDPTMLLTKEDYIRLIETEKEPRADGTLFNYILDPDATKTAFVKRVADEMKLKPFQVLPKYQVETRTKEDVKKRIEDCVFPEVTTWLRAFMDAKMTIVDSFHGMVFSIIFNKPFWVIGNKERGMSRFVSLLKMFGLENRMIDANDFKICDFSESIDWIKVNAQQQVLKNKSIEYLSNVLKNV